MNRSKRSALREPASVMLTGGLLLGAIGLLIQVFTGVPGFPTIPPGPIILVVAAAFVAFAPWRWSPIVGVLVALAILVGAVVNFSAITDRLADPADFGPFAGTALQTIGLLIALVAGVLATTRALQGR